MLDKIKEEKGDEAAEDFKKRAGGGVKAILENFKNWEFYVGMYLSSFPCRKVIVVDLILSDEV